nr:hypothetical protein [Patescibacteria group bacterium]
MNEVVSYNPDLFEAIKAGMGLHELDLGNEQLASACKNLFKSEVYARGWVFRVAGDNSGDRFEFHLQNNKNDLPVISRSKEMVEAEGGFLADMRALRVSVGDLFRILVV